MTFKIPNLESLKIEDMQDTGFFKGVYYTNSIKNFYLKMNKFDTANSSEIAKFRNLENLSYSTYENVHYHPEMKDFPKIKSLTKFVGDQFANHP